MKKIYNFSKGFLPCAILSAVIILSGIASLVFRGINLGIDFKSGQIEEVKIAGASSVDSVRDALSGISGVSVKAVGGEGENLFQIRTGSKEDVSENNEVEVALKKTFGADSVQVMKTDFIAAQMSQTLALQSVALLLGTMLLIWLYATVRFHWDFALGSIVALLHDICIMFTFFSWTQLEFSTTTLAAVLTLVGYSINATVVILDRIRYNLPLMEVHEFKQLINKSLSDTLSRSIITTVTTLFAVISLYVFTEGSIKDFALAMIVGLISGCYSSIFISSGLISFIRRNWKPEYGIHSTAPKKNA